ncbi:hypothetical protein SNE40_000592 [Patella caerulea]|uniref:phosphatidylinositol-3,4,5-trisphosphate 5-phosphatase n=1 Tax=Patella caerulea TaxID=87958 RepID=A0AAN8KHE1_PATCE
MKKFVTVEGLDKAGKSFRSNGSVTLRNIHIRMCAQFFHKGISRLQTEELLLAAKDDGSFLVRDSESLPGAYVLCLLYQSRVHQYRILPDKDGKLSVQSEGDVQPLKFNTLADLIQAYLLRDSSNGLVYALKKPVPTTDGVENTDMDDSEDEECFLDTSLDEHFAALDAETETDSQTNKGFKYGFLSNFARLDLSCCDGEFVEELKRYTDTGMEKDAINIRSKPGRMPDFEKLVHSAAKGLQRELDVFLLKMSLCHDLLTQNEEDGPKRSVINGADDASTSIFDYLSRKLSTCKTEVLNLEKKALEVIKDIPQDPGNGFDHASSSTSPDGTLGLSPSNKKSSLIPLSTFEVKVSKSGKFSSKMTLTIDIRAGRFFAVKPSKDFLDSSNTFDHDKILQLVKNTSDSSKLDIIIEGKKKYTYQFESAHARENFCLQIRQMKSMHSTEKEVDQISIFIGTWNMAKSGPSNSLKQWLKCNGSGKPLDRVLSKIPHGIYVIGTQESGLNDKDWTNTLKASLKATLMADVDVLETCTLWGIRMVILIDPQYRNIISHVQKSTVRTGIANKLGNKGAVGISFQINGTPFSFVNAHLTSGEERCSRRNQNFRDILKGLNLGPKNMDSFDITHKFHHVFFFGDLNYRVSDKIDVILKKAENRDIAYLLEKDQLRKVQFDKKAFYTFNESEISFMPTYKLDRYRPGYSYDWKKIKKTSERINAPSWCDRILWHSLPGTFIENTAYGCAENLLNSDHRPVFASFTVGVASQFVQSRVSLTDDVSCKIRFNRVEAQVKTCCKQYFILEFYSGCLADIICCESNKSFKEDRTGFNTCPMWSKDQLPELRPLFSDQDYLEEQHILIAVKSIGADNESYGECVISLKNMFDNEPHTFDSVLTHNGEETGRMRGEMFIAVAASYRSHKSKKSYELVSLDTEYHDPEEWLPNAPFFERRQESSLKVVSNRTFSPMATPRKNVVSADELLVNNILSNSGSDSDSHWSNNGAMAKSTNGVTGSNSPVSMSRRPKPIMGQSSLQAAQRQVMPVVATTSNSGALKSTEPILLGGVLTTTNPAGGVPNYINCPTGIPPPLPRKTKPSIIDKLEKKPAYAELMKPKTTYEWLCGLGLEEYFKAFQKKGWETVSKVIDLSTTDLLKLGIYNTDHKNRILQSIQEMKNKVL